MTIHLDTTDKSQATKVAGTLRRAVRSPAFTVILGGRHMECAYYFDFHGGISSEFGWELARNLGIAEIF
jgi:hypothetical protein